MDQDHRASRKFRKELNSGTAALDLLTLLNRNNEPMYGYEITRVLAGSAGSIPIMTQGALYPVLRSMEGMGLLESEVRPSDAGPSRKYYTVTREGRSVLGEWRGIWIETRDYVDSVLEESCSA